MSLRVADPGTPCKPSSVDQPAGTLEEPIGPLNPHHAIIAPLGREQDFRELLDDFDSHCHDLIEFDPRDFASDAHIKILSLEQQQELQTPRELYGPPHPDPKTIWLPGPPKPKVESADVQGSASLSEVFFNRRRTVAMVLAETGGFSWTVLERHQNAWQELPWRSMHVNY